MGCFNVTCAITNLPIQYGEKVQLFILRYVGLGNDGGGSCYSADIWSPICDPIEGTYNDYGNIENIIINDITKKLLNILKSNFKLNEAGLERAKYYDLSTDVSKYKLEDYLMAIERDFALEFDDFSNKWLPLGHMFVLDEVYQEIIAKTSFSAFMDNTRRFYSPQTGKGGQDDGNLTNYKLLNNCIAKIIDRREIENAD